MPALESGRPGFDSALAGCVLLDILLNFSEPIFLSAKWKFQ